MAAAAAAKSLQSCPTLCDPRDDSSMREPRDHRVCLGDALPALLFKTLPTYQGPPPSHRTLPAESSAGRRGAPYPVQGILRCAGKVRTPCRQSRGIDPPVSIRRGEGAHRKWCREFWCFPRTPLGPCWGKRLCSAGSLASRESRSKATNPLCHHQPLK